MTVQMMYVIPRNIEASMFAIVTACLTFSSDWGGDMLGAGLCQWFGITAKDMGNLPQVILLKALLLVLAVAFVGILPTDRALRELGLQLNRMEDDDDSIEEETARFS